MSLLAEYSFPAVGEPAWLQPPYGPPRLLGVACTLGRSTENDLHLADNRVSRQHAVIRSRGSEGYFVSDLGSVNGTFLNGRPLTQRTRLFHGDRLTVGGAQFTFHQPNGLIRPDTAPLRVVSLTEGAGMLSRWLLVATVAAPTAPSHHPPPECDPPRLQGWFDDSRELIENAGGALGHYTGDGFLAHWQDRLGTVGRVAGALREFRARQGRRDPPFRIMLHHGKATLSDAGHSGAPGLTGEAVNFILRMGRIAGAPEQPTLLSVPARALLGDHLPVTDAEVHDVSSFPGPFAFYALG